jgi:hypothetical protein
MMMLRNSERGSFKTCRFRWSWTWRDGLQAREAPRALRFGDLIHRALAAYYIPGRKRGPRPSAVFARLYQEQAKALRDDGFDVYGDEKWMDALDLGVGMLDGYVERFKDADAEYEVLSSEQVFQRVIRAPAKVVECDGARIYIPAFSFKIVGTLDGVWRHRSSKRVGFKEFKTATSISEDGLAMDEQPTLYWTYGPRRLVELGVIKQREADDIDWILYTFLRKAIPDLSKARNEDGQILNKPSKDALLEEFARLKRIPKDKRVDAMIAELGPTALQLGEVAKTQPAPYFHRFPARRDANERALLHQRVIEEARDIWLARRGLVHTDKNPGPLHNPNCRGCAVKDACEAHEAGGDFQSVLNATTTRWAPYAAHELPERS